MKTGFLCPHVPGHLNPMVALARQLQSRNHEVVFITSRLVEPLVRAAGLPFASFGEEESLSALREKAMSGFSQLSKLQGEDASRFALQSVARRIEGMWHTLPKVLVEEGVDGLVLDTYLFYSELIPMRLGMPYIHVSNALPFDWSGHTPLCLYGWPHETTPAAVRRNREGIERFTGFVTGINTAVRMEAQKLGLKVDWNDLGATVSNLAWLSQMPKEFDFEDTNWPSQFHHTGPFHDGTGRVDVDFPWEHLTGEPLVYASMGTLANGRPEIFRAIVSAVANQKKVQLVLAAGDQISREQIGPAPGNAIIVKKAPQLELLKRSSLCITHAGLNTVLEALTQGVPQVAIPVTHDQPGVAARIASRKTGVVTSLDKSTPAHLSELVSEVLDDSSYRKNAQRIQEAIARNSGLSRAADVIEQAFEL
jgi:zeaxanthin glucosyltransferase